MSWCAPLSYTILLEKVLHTIRAPKISKKRKNPSKWKRWKRGLQKNWERNKKKRGKNCVYKGCPDVHLVFYFVLRPRWMCWCRGVVLGSRSRQESQETCSTSGLLLCLGFELWLKFTSSLALQLWIRQLRHVQCTCSASQRGEKTYKNSWQDFLSRRSYTGSNLPLGWQRLALKFASWLATEALKNLDEDYWNTKKRQALI